MGRVRKLQKKKSLTPQEQAYAKEICEKYHDTVVRIINAYLGPDLTREREDITQDVFRMVCEQLDDFKSYDNPEALVFKMTARRVQAVRKKLERYVPLPDENALIMEDGVQGADLFEWFPNSLPDKDKEVLQKVYGEKRDVAEAAAEIGVPAATMRQRLKRAKDRLRKELKKT